MEITGGAGFSGFDAIKGSPKAGVGGPDDGPLGSFGDVFGKLVDQLEATQGAASDAVERLALGEDVDLHEVVTAMEMETISFQIALQARNRLVETVNTVMNMQV